MTFAPLASCTLLYLAKENPARSGSAWSAFLAATELVKAAEALLQAGYHLEDVCGLDAQEGALCVYHFDHFTKPGRVTLRVLAPHDDPTFPSIAPLFHGAEWHERETYDFYGFTFSGNPNHVPLLLPDDMAHVNPLCKDEAARAPLRTLLAAADREVLFKAAGFTLMDAPVQEEPVPAEQPAPVAASKPADEPEVPSAAPASLPAVKGESAPALKGDASLVVKGESALTIKPEAPLVAVPEKQPVPEAKTTDAPAKKSPAPEVKKGKTPAKKPAPAVGKKGGASNA